MQLFNGLPIYVVDINDASVFNNVSIVDMPAIERNFIQLSKEIDFQFSVNEEKRTISGPVLIPDFPIYRRFGEEEFYIKFTAETIKEYAIKFFKDGREGEGNIQWFMDAGDCDHNWDVTYSGGVLQAAGGEYAALCSKCGADLLAGGSVHKLKGL